MYIRLVVDTRVSPDGVLVARPAITAHRFSCVGTYTIRVFGLNAPGCQFLPPCHEGQKSAILPMSGFLLSSISGRPVFGSSCLKTFCLTYGFPSTNLIAPSVRSRKYR